MTYNPFQNFSWKLAHGRILELGLRGVLMAIVNVTPDSFSDGGRFIDAVAAAAQGVRCLQEGALILDIGGESTRPDAAAVSAEEEQGRILPVISALSRDTDALISVDTYRASTARLAVEAGAHIVNRISRPLLRIPARGSASCIPDVTGRSSPT